MALSACIAAGSASGQPAASGASRHAAAGPVAAIGTTSVGDSKAVRPDGYLDASGPYALRDAASVASLTGYVAGGGSPQRMRAVIYRDSFGRPGPLAAVSGEVTIAAGAAAAWVDFPLPGPVALDPGDYWLGYWLGGRVASEFYAAVPGRVGRYAAAAYSSTANPPAAFGPSTSDPFAYSLYAALLPASTAPPTISGTPAQGQTLTALEGSWTGSPSTFAYRWQRCETTGAACTDIAGAAGKTYAVAAADVGSTLRVVVSALAGGASAGATSAPTAVVQGPPPAGPTLGNTSIGASRDMGGGGFVDVAGPYSLAAPGSVAELTGFVQGGRSAEPLRGVIYADDHGKPGGLVAVSSEVTVPAGAPRAWIDFPFAAPVTLPAGSYWLGYWFGASTALVYSQPGAGLYTPAVYSSVGPPPAQFGAGMPSSLGLSLFATVSAAAGAPVNVTPPTIPTSDVEFGAIVTATPGTWTNSPTSFSYQWQRCDDTGASCVDDGPASSAPTFQGSGTGVVGDEHALRVLVTATNAAGPSAAAVSAVRIVAPHSKGEGLFFDFYSPAPVQGQAFTYVDEGDDPTIDWYGAQPITIAYQWRRCDGPSPMFQTCSDITGANARSYVPTAADVGHRLELVLTATNAGGSGSFTNPVTELVVGA